MADKNITVYCGSSSKLDDKYYSLARETGKLIAQKGFGLVTGGGCMGMMKAVQDGCLDAGGEAIGILPQFMIDNGWNDNRLTETISVPDMSARKNMMMSLGYGCIALPGGVGTWDELTEMLTARQLGLYHGHVVTLDYEGFYSGLIKQIETALKEKFFGNEHKKLFETAVTPQEAVEKATAPLIELTVPKHF